MIEGGTSDRLQISMVEKKKKQRKKKRNQKRHSQRGLFV